MSVRNSYQMPLMQIDRLIKLVEVEAALAKVFPPAPSRPTIVGWIDEGILEGRQIGGGNNWFVYSSSLDAFILASQRQSQQRMAA